MTRASVTSSSCELTASALLPLEGTLPSSLMISRTGSAGSGAWRRINLAAALKARSKRNLQTHDEVKLVHKYAMQGVDVVRRDVDHRDATAGSFLERVGAEIGFCVSNLHGCIQKAGGVSVVPLTVGISQE